MDGVRQSTCPTLPIHAQSSRSSCLASAWPCMKEIMLLGVNSHRGPGACGQVATWAEKASFCAGSV